MPPIRFIAGQLFDLGCLINTSPSTLVPYHNLCMHRAITTPSSERLPFIIEQESKQAPQRDQAHVRHDRRHKARLLYPGSDESTEVPPS